VVREISSPAVRHVRFSQHADESAPHALLLERHFDLIRHVHLNELDGRHPGAGPTISSPCWKFWLAAATRLAVAGVFDFGRRDFIARQSLRYLHANSRLSRSPRASV